MNQNDPIEEGTDKPIELNAFQKIAIVLGISVIMYFLGSHWISGAISHTESYSRDYWKPGMIGDVAKSSVTFVGIVQYYAGHLLMIGGVLLTPFYLLQKAFKRKSTPKQGDE